MYDRLKISAHQHSGRLCPHEHTSYLPLLFLIFIVGVALSRFTYSAFADSPGPAASSVSLTGTMPAKPPKIAATITSPFNGQHFTTSPIKVAGTCSNNTLVEIFKNNIFAGSAPCGSDGHFSIDIDLLFGKNILTARVFDVLNQAGPVSKSVTVFYDSSLLQAAPTSLFNFSDNQLLLETDAAYRGIFPNQSLNVPITVIGGTAPFAVNIQWGDASNEVVSRSDNSTFNTSHTYKKPGTFKITLQGSDSKKLVAFLTVAAIVNGNVQLNPAGGISGESVNKFLILWPVYAIAATMVISFWLGEKREKKVLESHPKDQKPPFNILTPQNPAQSPPQNT